MLHIAEDISEFFNYTRSLVCSMGKNEYFLKKRTIKECCNDIVDTIISYDFDIKDIDPNIKLDFDCERLLRFRTWIILNNGDIRQHWINYFLSNITDYTIDNKEEIKTSLPKYEVYIRDTIFQRYKTNDIETK